jgi:ATP adenylyltransferase
MEENLWAPWRMNYIKQLAPGSDAQVAPGLGAAEPAPEKSPAREDGGHGAPERAACFLCEAAAAQPGTDLARQRLLLVHDQRGVIVLNRYPYTTGHLLAAPAEHLADLTDLSPDQRAGLMELTALAEQVTRLAFGPQGINVGINIGRCAGAGLPGHLHVHIVPRWNGDTNFMSIVGQVRVIPQAIEESYAVLAAALRKI